MSQATSISSQLSLWVKNCSRSELKRARSAGAEHLAKARPRLTKNDDLDPSTTLIGKKAGKFIAPGSTVTIQVRNSNGLISNSILFMHP